MSTLEDFFKEQSEVTKINEYCYTFTYKGVRCGGIVFSFRWADYLTIKPLSATETINGTAGTGIQLIFEK